TGNLGVLGFALGIPLIIETEAEKKRDPMRDGLTMGEMADRAADTDLRVLVATFFGGSGKFYNGAPPLGDLYWRGPVLWTFADGQWSGREGWQTRTARMRGKITHQTLDAELRETGLISVYDVKLFPHRGHWLYAMDFPAAVPPSTFITRDYQLQNLNPVREILNYPMMSYLDYRAGPDLDEETRALALQYPDGANPKTLALGQALLAEHRQPIDIAKAGMAHFKGDFAYGMHFGGIDGANAVDRFLFDRRSGYAGHYATAYALMMRAAGIPTRMVVGYRGGVHLGLTNKVYVMENNAHAWAEIWLDRYGWVRMDPATVFAGDGKAETDGWGLGEGLGPSPEEDVREEEEEGSAAGQAFETADADSFRTSAASGREEASWWSRWVTDLDARAQVEILKGLSLDGSWRNLLALGGALLAAIAGVMLAASVLWRVWRRRHLPRIDQLAAWATGTLRGPARRPCEGFRSYVLARTADVSEPATVKRRLDGLCREMSAALYADASLARDWPDRWRGLLKDLRAARSGASP
ncbi:MAG: transglutaminaseTgpA domain-containing protein, partial [Pseudomonadota bacterium]